MLFFHLSNVHVTMLERGGRHICKEKEVRGLVGEDNGGNWGQEDEHNEIKRIMRPTRSQGQRQMFWGQCTDSFRPPSQDR